MTGLPLTLALGGGLAFVVMTLLWMIQRRTHNAGIVDLGWSGLIPLIVALGGVIAYLDRVPSTVPIQRLVVAYMACGLWGGRLVWHIHRRAHGQPEDRRYATLRTKWGPNPQPKFFLFFQFQAAAALLFAIPYLLVIGNAAPTFHPLEIAGAALWFIAWAGEATADHQLASFKADPANRGKVCDVGLWSWSRHPNYFFEWLIWVAVSIAALAAPHGLWAWICPALMLFFLFKVTGIPATEEQALKSKGDAYRRYQQTTSVFVPLPPSHRTNR
jgi:steroid 5-alpha reductase family enzyme